MFHKKKSPKKCYFKTDHPIIVNVQNTIENLIVHKNENSFLIKL